MITDYIGNNENAQGSKYSSVVHANVAIAVVHNLGFTAVACCD